MTISNNNMVNAIVRVAGKQVHFVNLEIVQVYGDHHHFSLELDHDIAGNGFMHEPTEQMDFIGRFVIIDIQHGTDNGTAYVFKGIVTKVSLTGRDGRNGYLVLEGSSPTIMLERGKRMDVYSNMSLQSIFKKLIDGVYSDYMQCLNDPTFDNKIEFLMQYNETDWEFLKRIAYQFGENLFYSGSEILFGAYEEWEAIKLTYDKEVSDIEFVSKMVPNNNIAFQYIAEQDTVLEKQSPKDIENSNMYLDTMEELNLALTNDKPAKNVISAPVFSNSEMTEMQKRSKVRAAAQTVFIKGKSKSYESTIGRLITILMPEGMSKTGQLGTYRVVKSIHRIDERLRYSNEFEAVPASLTTMPVAEPRMPVAESVIGKVSSHEDPKGLGRVQVDFAFANQYSRIWMRVMAPNAGLTNDGQKNRGMVFVPEKGDQVMVGFEYGDPNRPYVMGSMFHSSNGQGGQADNHIKSIITRSGHTIEFDDAQDTLGITIKDKNGNVIHLDTKGKNIEITAPETITMNSKNMIFNVNENMNINVGKDVTSTVGGNQTESIAENLNINANNLTTSITQNAVLKVTENYTQISGEADIATEKANYIVKSAGRALIQGAEDARISKG